jgi:hypothetical protein
MLQHALSSRLDGTAQRRHLEHSIPLSAPYLALPMFFTIQ